MSRTPFAVGVAALLMGCPADPELPDAFTVTPAVESIAEQAGTVEDVALVELNLPAVDPVEVWVETSDETRLLPTHHPFVIQPDDDSVAIDLVVTDDAAFTGDTTVSVTVSALGLEPQSFDVEVTDDDAIELQLAVQDPNIVEGSGVLAGYAVVSTGGVVGSDLAIDVTADDATELVVPATVTVLAGTNEVAFDVDAVDDAVLDFDRTVTISVSDGTTSDEVEVTVLDDESAALTVVVPDSVGEGDGDGVGTVMTSAPVEDGLGISLVSADTDQLRVTSSVWLDPGASQGSFALTAVDDVDPDFDVDVAVTAAATGCVDAVVPVRVLDDESGFAIELMGPVDADEQWVDFGAMPAFMGGTDWAIVQTFTVPEGAEKTGYQWMRGKAWEDQAGDITANLTRTWLDEQWEWVPGAWIVGHGSLALNPEGDGPKLTEGSGWHTAVVQHDNTASVVVLYIDGTFVAQTDLGDIDDSANTNPLVWGGQWVAPAWGLGDLYNETDTTILHQAWLQRLLTPAEIAAYDGSIDLDDPALFFATAIGRDGVRDVSGGGRDGIVHGAPAFYRP